MTESKIKQVRKEILEEIKPKEEERDRIFKTVSTVIERLKDQIKQLRIDAHPELEGSVAHGTWISGERDIDIFILFPLQTPLDQVKKIGLELGRRASEGQWKERYAEHPFVEATIDNYRIDIVPCYEISRFSERVTSVDRTPLHTEYLAKKVKDKEKEEIILLKAFMKGIGVYGAELRINGFSGYLCELLILHFGSFERVLKAALQWGCQQVIDIEKHYSDSETAEMLFKEPLVVVDPVDPTRNVAAAVSSDRIGELKGAAGAFLNDPSTKFFKPEPLEPMTSSQLRALMKSRGTDTLFIMIPLRKISSDIVWGELRKSLKAIKKLLELNDFTSMNSDVWSDEETKAIMAIELSTASLPSVKAHQGPAAGDPNQQKFLDKHLQNESRLAGPWIKEGKWYVELGREFTSAKALIERKLRNESATAIGLSKDVGAWLKDGGRVFMNEEILPLYSSDSNFAMFITRYLKKQPIWFFRV